MLNRATLKTLALTSEFYGEAVLLNTPNLNNYLDGFDHTLTMMQLDDGEKEKLRDGNIKYQMFRIERDDRLNGDDFFNPEY